MAPRRKRNAEKEKLDRDMRRNRFALFIQQFQKEAQERMNELEARLESMLSTVDKLFDVELLKLPPSLKSTRMGDLISEEDDSTSDVSIAMKNEAIKMRQRGNHRRALSSDSPPVRSISAQKSSAKTSKGGNNTKKPRTLTGSNSTGSIRGSSATVKRNLSRVTKASDQTAAGQLKHRSVVSTGNLHCSVDASALHVTMTTAQGQTVSFSDENKGDINWELLDDMALCQIKKLASLMAHLSEQSRGQQ